ncbi:MAG: hypothetical protein K6G91_00030 [Kiritimatiellae bacterium]|nr:hypothetical protein [Kiritimatiellia bacterium]
MRTSLAQIGTVGKSVEAIRSDVSALKSGKRKPGSGRKIPEEKAAAAKRVWESYKARPGSENTRPTIGGAAPVAKLAETVVRAAKIAELRSSPRGGRRSSSAMASAG